jgi:hypothetical protein
LSAVQAEYGSQGMAKDNFEQADLSTPARVRSSARPGYHTGIQ